MRCQHVLTRPCWPAKILHEPLLVTMARSAQHYVGIVPSWQPHSLLIVCDCVFVACLSTSGVFSESKQSDELDLEGKLSALEERVAKGHDYCNVSSTACSTDLVHSPHARVHTHTPTKSTRFHDC